MATVKQVTPEPSTLGQYPRTPLLPNRDAGMPSNILAYVLGMLVGATLVCCFALAASSGPHRQESSLLDRLSNLPNRAIASFCDTMGSGFLNRRWPNR